MHESSGATVIIPAGGEKILKATFDPLAHGPEGVGAAKRELLLKTNSTETPQIKIVFTVNVINRALNRKRKSPLYTKYMKTMSTQIQQAYTCPMHPKIIPTSRGCVRNADEPDKNAKCKSQKSK